jgi:hypothetical protein
MIASLVSLQGAFRATAIDDTRDKFRTFVGLVPPGRIEDRIPFAGWGMHLRFGVELAFQDASGRNWLRQGTGNLVEAECEPVELYDVALPVPWHR